MIVMLSIGSKSLLMAFNNDDFSTGELMKSDTTNVIIPVDYIRRANIKLIERRYLLSISKEQDSIINLKDCYIAEQDSIIKDMQNRIILSNNINNEAVDKIDKQKTTINILSGTTAALTIVVILSLIFN